MVIWLRTFECEIGDPFLHIPSQASRSTLCDDWVPKFSEWRESLRLRAMG